MSLHERTSGFCSCIIVMTGEGAFAAKIASARAASSTIARCVIPLRRGGSPSVAPHDEQSGSPALTCISQCGHEGPVRSVRSDSGSATAVITNAE